MKTSHTLPIIKYIVVLYQVFIMHGHKYVNYSSCYSMTEVPTLHENTVLRKPQDLSTLDDVVTN